MPEQMKISLIITTYNSAKLLDNCLRSVSRQVEMPCEVIIADDGSSDNTKDVVNAWRKQIPVPIKHVWQEDKGFRASRVRNLAFANAEGDYLIIIDGDIILNKYFILDHHEIAREGCFVCGSRVVMSPELTKYMQDHELTELPLSHLSVDKWPNTFRNKTLRNMLAPYYGQRLYKGRSCNMAFWKKDMEKVNGFNEDFVGWGLEDTDFIARMQQAGIKKHFLKFGGIQYHQYHKERPANNFAERQQLIADIVSSKLPYRCSKGYDRHLVAVKEQK